MMPNEYHKLLANQILGCDIERLDAAIREETGHGLITFIKANLPGVKRGNLSFRDFNLMRFATKTQVFYMGKVPAHDGAETKVYGIQCDRRICGEHKATATINGKIIFEIKSTSYSMLKDVAIGALHTYCERRRSNLRRSKAAKKRRMMANKQKKAEVQND